MRVLAAALLFWTALASEDKSNPPPFFLQDPTDALCLGGEKFKRCSIDTLFYVEGTPGNYQIKKRPATADGAEEEGDDGLCIAKKSCKESDASKIMDAKLAKCSHCGAKNWNILGDSESGYVLTESDGASCLVREPVTDKAMTAPCDAEEISYTPFQLQFASAADIKTMSSPGARMIGAASDGDLKAIQALIKEGVDVNVRDWDDLTALIPAASSGHLDICKFLVKEGVDVNAKDKDGITALMEASIMGHTKIVDFLIENGAEVEATASSDVTALWLAASEGKTDCMKSLLKKGADASNTRVDGISAVMTASAGGHTDAVKLLLESGADAAATDGDGLTALMNAAENGSLAVVKLLVEHTNDADYLNSMSNTGFNAFIIAAAHGHSEVLDFLIDAGADVTKTHENGVTALMYAAASDHLESIKVLLEKAKVDIEAKHTNGGTAILEATTAGVADSIKLLVEYGAKVDFIDDDGVTPLMAVASQGSTEGVDAVLDVLKKQKSPEELKEHINLLSFSGGSAIMFAAAGGHPESTKKLIDLGADVKAIAKATPDYLVKLKKMIEDGTVQEEDPHVDGVTALHVAAQGGHLECVNLLIEHGADVTVLDEENRSALQLAVKGNHGEVASALVAAGADPNTPYIDGDGDPHNLLFDAIMVENEEFAKLLIEKGADIYHQDEKKVTTLLQASHRGMPDIAKLLLEKHAASGKEGYLDDPNEDGVTPLIAAASEGHAEIVKMLIAAKANLDAKDKDGTNALMVSSARGSLQVVTELLDAGAIVNEQNSDGHTALMFAYNGKNQVETLWERYNQFVAESNADETSEEEADDSGTGPIIRDALDNHTALVDLLLKRGADASLKDKEGHTAKDFDFNGDADAEVLDKEAKAEQVRDESKNEL